MTDIDRRLRELGERVRHEQPPSVLRAETLRAAGRRRVGTIGLAAGVLAAVAFGSSYAIGSLLDAGPDIGPFGPSQTSFARLFSAFSEDEQAIVEVNAAAGTVCADLTSLKGHGSFTRVEIVTSPAAPQTFIPVLPSDSAFTPEGDEADCVRDVDADMASAIIEQPQDYFLLVDGPGEDVRVSALTLESGDGNFATGPRIMIAEGQFQGQHWEYYGYESNDGLCLSLAIAGTSGGGCGFPDRSDGRAITIRSVGTGPGVATIDGEVPDEVDSLEIEIGDGPSQAIELYEPPSELGLDDRVFVHLIDIDRFVGNPRVWLVAYAASGELLSRLRVEGFEDAADQRQRARRQEGFALWPEDTAREAEEACDDGSSPTRTFRYDPMSAALEFGNAVLGWKEAIGIRRELGHDAQSIELRRSAEDNDETARGAAVLVTLTEVANDCWSVWGVSRLPDERPTGVSISIRGRDVEIGFDDLGANSLYFEIGHGYYTNSSDPEPPDGRITALLNYPRGDTGHFLLLFKDENGQVFSAAGGALPAGDFTAG